MMTNSAIQLAAANTTASKPLAKYTWSPSSGYSGNLLAYMIQQWIEQESEDGLTINPALMGERHSEEHDLFQIGTEEFAPVMIEGKKVFCIAHKIYLYKCQDTRRGLTHTIYGNEDIHNLVEAINAHLKWNNPLRRKHLHLTQGSEGIEWVIKPPPKVLFDDLIIDDEIKADIYDQTIFHLEHLEGNNGIILHGEPGTGKSLCCQAVISEAHRRGYSTAFLTTQVNYTKLEEFVERILAPCVLVFEDIDSFGESREDGANQGLSDFLQFLSGLTGKRGKIIFIATTNHIKLLDAAIANRPARFNRRYHFTASVPKEIDRLIDLYFRAESIDADQRRICYGKNFTGAHIQEIHRTAQLLALKRGKSLAEVFTDATVAVERAFPKPPSDIGFQQLALAQKR